MALATNKQLGFVAAILTIIGLLYSFLTLGQTGYSFSGVSTVYLLPSFLIAPLGFIGFILFLVAMYGLSKNYQDQQIFNYVLYGLIISIVLGVVVGGIAIFIVLINISSFTSPPFAGSGTQFLQNYIESLLPVFLVASFISLVPAWFNRLAFNRLANKSGVRLFRMAGLLGVAAAAATIALWFIGAALFYADILTINNMFSLSVVGSAVSLAAWVLAAKAFYSIPVPPRQTYSTRPAQAPPPAAGPVKYCPYCGTANAPNAEYCVHCGKKQ